jgi:hypothetical protein
MDILDQALERLERELYAALERSTDPKITSLLSDIKSVKATKEILGREAVPTIRGSLFAPTSISKTPQTVSTNGNGHAALITQGDAAVEIIRKAGRPVHISEIMAEFPKYGITNAKKANLASILKKDRRNRFINRGQATFILNPHPRADAEQKPRPQSGLPQGFSLIEAIKALLPELKHGEFSMPVIYQILTDRNPPHVAQRIQKASISTTLSVLKERGLIEVTHEGNGNDPRRYKVKDVT